MAKKKVLYVIHTHPAIRPGGAEGYALKLYDAMRASDRFRPMVLARNGLPQTISYQHPRSLVTLVGDDPNQYLLETDANDWIYQLGASANKVPLTRYYRDFLLVHRPDVVHFQHTLYLGYDIIRLTRNLLPDCAIVYTLHEYGAICHRDGQMVRTMGDQLCLEESPRRCHECFPTIPPREFYLRKRFIQSHFDEVDLFVSPSRFLAERFVDWGIPREKIVFEENGALPAAPLPDSAEEDRRRARLGFFGQFSHYKGVNVLLRAMSVIKEEAPDVHLWLHGANLELQPEDFQAEFQALLEAAGDSVTLAGRYDAHELPELMAGIDYLVLPSLWWENSPLVIPEAFAYGRPVICTGIGGMAEKVTDGVNGLHFRVGDPRSLANSIQNAIKPGVWERLRRNLPPPHTMTDHVRNLSRHYDELIERRALSPEARRGAGLEPIA